jgi:hypothetical protein
VYSGNYIPDYPKQVTIPLKATTAGLVQQEGVKTYQTKTNVEVLEELNAENVILLLDPNIPKVDIEVDPPKLILQKKRVNGEEVELPALRFTISKNPKDYT